MSCRISDGLSFVELIICLFLISILCSLAIPSLTHLYFKHKLKSQSQMIISIFQSAKNIALIEGVEVSLCGSSDGRRCDGQWSRGLLVNKHLQHMAEYEEVIYYKYWTSPRVDIRWHGFQSQNKITLSHDLLSSTASGHFVLSSSQASVPEIILVINRLGRIREQ